MTPLITYRNYQKECYLDTQDVNRINEFFIDREEEAVIKLKALEDKINEAADPSEFRTLSSALIDFHGEMVLLLHWSVNNHFITLLV